MSKIIIKVDSNRFKGYLNRLRDRLDDLSVPFADIGELLLLSHRERWDAAIAPDGSSWTALSPKYAAKKPKNKNKILVLDGVLWNLVYQTTADTLIFGTNSQSKDYAATHQFGDDSRNIPARPFLGLSDDDMKEVTFVLSDYLLDDT